MMVICFLAILKANAQDPINSNQTINQLPCNYRTENINEVFNEAILYPKDMWGNVKYPNGAFPASRLKRDSDGTVYFIGKNKIVYSYSWNKNTTWNLDQLSSVQYALLQPEGGLLLSNSNIYGIGVDGRAYNFYKTGGVWKFDWLNSGQPVPLDYRAGLTADAAGNIYGIGKTGIVYHFTYTGGSWQFSQLASQYKLMDPRGGLTYEAASGKIYAIGKDGKVYNFYKVGSTWQFNWLQPNQYATINAVGGLAIDGGKVYCIGTDGKVYNYYWNGSSWQFDWLQPNQYATINANGGLAIDGGKIYCIGNDGKVYNYYWSGSSWQFDWLQPNQYATINPAGKLTIDNGKVYCIGTDGKVYNYYWDGKFWQFNWLNSQQKVVADPAIGVLASDRLVYFGGKREWPLINNYLGVFYYKAEKLDYKEWGTPVFDEEFNYNSSSDAAFVNNWLPQYTWGHSNNSSIQWEYNSANSLSFIPDGTTDKMLRITANNIPIWGNFDDNQAGNVVLNDGIQNYRKFDFTSGTITSNQPFQYGLFEIRAKYPSGVGFWPAFWTIGDDSWPPEMDILECRGSAPYENSNNVWWRRTDNDALISHASMEYKGAVNYTQAFHTFSMVWTPTFITFYVDGNELRTVDHHVPLEPMKIIANLAIGLQHPTASTVFPNYMDIDYIKVYQKASYGGPKSMSLVTTETLENGDTEDFVVYPNPGNSVFNIQLNFSGAAKIQITDMLGNKVNEGEMNNDQYSFDLSGYAKGIYLIKVISDNKIVTKKIIME